MVASGIVNAAPGIYHRAGAEKTSLRICSVEEVGFETPGLKGPLFSLRGNVSGVKMARVNPPANTSPSERNSGVHIEDGIILPAMTGPSNCAERIAATTH